VLGYELEIVWRNPHLVIPLKRIEAYSLTRSLVLIKQRLSDGEQNMLKIQRSSNGQVVFTLSGQMEEEDQAELEALINAETGGIHIVLDLKNLIMVGRDTVVFLARCEADGVTLVNSAEYVREWITRQRQGS
jgi:hypothetical protein